MKKGIIIKGVGGFYTVCSFDDNKNYVLKARGIFRKSSLTPTVGDRISFSLDDNNEGVIEAVEKRKNLLKRPPISNIDQMVIISSVKSPKIDYLLIDKMMINAYKQDLPIVLCINKIDLSEEDEIKKIEENYKHSGAKLYFISVKEKTGIEELKQTLYNKVSVLSGSSGVGKSSVLNEICENEMNEVGGVSKKSDRGRHTTRHLELFPLKEKGYVADTPGFSSLEINDIPINELWKYYVEFFPYSDCRFNTCLHENEPSCKVKEAVKNGQISKLRYENYLKLLNLIRQNKVTK